MSLTRHWSKEFRGERTAFRQHAQPLCSPVLELRAEEARHIALADHAERSTAGVHHRNGADASGEHAPDGFNDGGFR
jgi:hypothetical protein